MDKPLHFMNKVRNLLYGLYASILAFFIIEGLLIEVILEGVMSPYQGLSLYFMVSLIPIGVIAYYGYLNWLIKGRNIFKYVSLAALILGSLSIYRGALGFQDALPILFAAYFTEVVVGPYLMKGFSEVDRPSALMFVSGILTFVFTLPLVTISSTLAIIPFLGNLLKGFGLMKLAHKIRSRGMVVSDVVLLQASPSS